MASVGICVLVFIILSLIALNAEAGKFYYHLRFFKYEILLPTNVICYLSFQSVVQLL